MEDMGKYHEFDEFALFFLEDVDKRPKFDINRFKNLIQAIIANAKTYPTDAIAQYHAAFAIRQYNEIGNGTELTYLNKALNIAPNFTLAYVRRLEIYFAQENYIAALENLIEAKNNLFEPPRECLSSLEEIETKIKDYQEKLLSNQILLVQIKELKNRDDLGGMDKLSKELYKTLEQNQRHLKLIQSDRLEELEKLNEQLTKMLMEDTLPDMSFRTLYRAKSLRRELIERIKSDQLKKIQEVPALLENLFSNELLIIMLEEFCEQNTLLRDSKSDDTKHPSGKTIGKQTSDKNPGSSLLRPLVEVYSRILVVPPKDFIEESKMKTDTIMVQLKDGFLTAYWLNNGKMQTHALERDETKSIIQLLPIPGEESRDQMLITRIMSKFQVPIPTLFASTESLVKISLIMQLILLTSPKYGVREILLLIQKSEQENISLKQLMLQMYRDTPKPIDHTMLYVNTAVREKLVEWMQGTISLITDNNRPLSEYLKNSGSSTQSYQSRQSQPAFFRKSLANSRDTVNPHFKQTPNSIYVDLFRLTRKEAHELLIERIGEISKLLIPAVENALLTEDFINYLRSTQIKDLTNFYKNYSKEKAKQAEEILKSSAKEVIILKAYIDYDVRDCKVASGWSHPLILRAIANLRNIQIRFWELNPSNGEIIPHGRYGVHQSLDLDNEIIKNLLLDEQNCFEFITSNFIPKSPSKIPY